MRKKIKFLIQVFLIVVLCFCSVNFVAKRIDIAKKDAEIAAAKERVREQELRNGELEDVLSEENEADFYREKAEDNLGYGDRDEKIYKLVPRS